MNMSHRLHFYTQTLSCNFRNLLKSADANDSKAQNLSKQINRYLPEKQSEFRPFPVSSLLRLYSNLLSLNIPLTKKNVTILKSTEEIINTLVKSSQNLSIPAKENVAQCVHRTERERCIDNQKRIEQFQTKRANVAMQKSFVQNSIQNQLSSTSKTINSFSSIMSVPIELDNSDQISARIFLDNTYIMNQLNCEFTMPASFKTVKINPKEITFTENKIKPSFDPKEVFLRYKKQSEEGNLDAMNQLGLCYQNGTGIERNLEKAIRLYKTASEKGNLSATFNLACCYENGVGVSMDHQESIRLLRYIIKTKYFKDKTKPSNDELQKRFKQYEDQARESDPQSMCHLALCYLKGEGTAKDERKAFKLFTKASNQHNSEATYYLAKCYFYGQGTYKDENQAINLYKIASQSGNSEATFILAYLHAIGRGLERNYTEAIRLYKNAMKAQHIGSIYHLAICYELELGVNYNSKEAIRMYKMVAESKRTFLFEDEANYSLEATLYRNGLTTKSYESAHYLEECYRNGIVTDRNIQGEIRLYEILSKQEDNVEATYKLATLYEQRNQNSDLQTAFNNYKIASAKGHVESTLKLASFYEKGIGTDQNFEEAICFYEIASKQRNNTEAHIMNHDKTLEFSTPPFPFSLSQYVLAVESLQNASSDYQKDIEVIQNMITPNNCFLSYDLAQSFEQGIGFKQNEDIAFNLYKISSEKEHIASTYKLASFYTGRHLEEAIHFYEIASSKSEQYKLLLAFCYMKRNRDQNDATRAFQLYESISNEGNFEATYYLARCHQQGFGTAQNYEKAFKSYTKASNGNFLYAIYNLGLFYEYGIGTTKNFDEAFQLYKRASQTNYIPAIYRLARCYEYGIGTESNFDSAFSLYSLASQFEQNPEEYQNVFRYKTITQIDNSFEERINGETIVSDPSFASTLYINQTKSLVQYRKGLEYENDKSIPNHQQKAFECFKVAAEHVAPETAYTLGALYYLGKNVKQDFNKAIQYYQQAYQGGVLKAALNLGLCYHYGEGVAKDYKKAFKYYQIAYDCRVPEAAFYLAFCYSNNLGVDLNYKQALHYFQQSYKSTQYPMSLLGLGYCYSNLRELDPDGTKAFQCYTQAYKAEVREAAYYLGICYANGHGVQQDYNKAIEYFKSILLTKQYIGFASFGLGYCYEHLGSQYDLQAFNYYSQAYNNDMGSAASHLGFCYAVGKGVQQDFKQALKMYQESFNRKHNRLDAFGIAYCYEHLPELDPDGTKAYKFYNQAYDFGVTQAAFYLLSHSDKRRSVESNRNESNEMYIQALIKEINKMHSENNEIHQFGEPEKLQVLTKLTNDSIPTFQNLICVSS